MKEAKEKAIFAKESIKEKAKNKIEERKANKQAKKGINMTPIEQ
jgi:hypothetical protein